MEKELPCENICYIPVRIKYGVGPIFLILPRGYYGKILNAQTQGLIMK